MDTITQMQEKQFEANELQAKLRREVVEEQSRTAAAEEEIKRLGNEMIDLRQAAGPTADLIKQLREDLERAKVVRLHAGM